ncbi:MAG: hypothetical protein AAGC70_01975 [Pseudomonadota bacterium]
MVRRMHILTLSHLTSPSRLKNISMRLICATGIALLIGKWIKSRRWRLVAGLAWLITAATPAHAQVKLYDIIRPPDVFRKPENQPFPVLDLKTAIAGVDAYIVKRTKASGFYKIKGFLFSIHFGPLPVSWRPNADGSNSHSAALRSLVFHAVCRENKRALLNLVVVDDAFSSSMFSELQRYYLNEIGQRQSVSARFRGDALPIPYASPSFTFGQIDDRWELETALRTGGPAKARRLISRFDKLCRLGRLKDASQPTLPPQKPQ